MNHEEYEIANCEPLYVREDGLTAETYTPGKQANSTDLEHYQAENYATSGTSGDIGNYIYRFPSNCDILREAQLAAVNTENAKTIKYVYLFITALQSVLLKNRASIGSSALLPPLKFRWIEDHSALIEWIFKDFRIGFTIEPDVSESGWYLVVNDNLQEGSASGELNFDDLEQLIAKLLDFALVNS